MKIIIILTVLLWSGLQGNAQIFKKAADKIKRDAEWRAKAKAEQAENKAIDSVIALPKKTSEKKKASATQVEKTGTNTAPSRTTPAKPARDPNDMTPEDGFITLSLSSPKAFTGFGYKVGIRISGESVKYKNFTEVQVVVKGPSSREARQLPLGADGKFYLDWNPSDETGDFTVTASSSDKKTSKSATFSVESLDLPDYDNWPKDNIDETKKALAKLEEVVDQADDGLSPKDKAELNEKLQDVKDKVDELLLFFKDLGHANKQLMQLAHQAKSLPAPIAGYLSDIDRALAEQAAQMKKMNETAVHKPQDNSICEYLVMVDEACAAFSTFTAPVGKVIKTCLVGMMNYGKDKKPVDNENTTNNPYTFFGGKLIGVYKTADKELDGVNTKLVQKLSFASDLAQFATTVLLKTYCGVIKGEIKHDYTINFRNGDGVTWWKYGAVMQGAIVLRYPKEGSKGKVIKMKGSIEGNATAFSFYENAEANDDFHDGTKGKIEVVELRVIKPATVPFVSSLNDPAGFGAVARGLTPASFYITIDAEYDVDAGKIKIFFNSALMDFTDAVNNQLIFLEIGADLLPYIKKMTFPIAKVFSTLGSVVRSNNEFSVVKDPKGNMSFQAKANKHLGTKSDKIEHDLNFSLFAKKE